MCFSMNFAKFQRTPFSNGRHLVDASESIQHKIFHIISILQMKQTLILELLQKGLKTAITKKILKAKILVIIKDL